MKVRREACGEDAAADDDDDDDASPGSPLQTLSPAATVNWAVFISTGTEIAFQIPHNLFPSLLHAHKGGIIEYPFAAYALADSRWAEYNSGNGLIREVCVRDCCGAVT